MGQRRTAPQIRRLLREVDRDLAKGLPLADICRKHDLVKTTLWRWRQRHDPTKVDQTRRVHELEREVQRLKQLVAELMLDRQMLQEVAKKKW